MNTTNTKPFFTRVATVCVSFMTVVAPPLLVAQVTSGKVYDAEADFSINSNPAGAWSYGYKSGLTNALVLYTQTNSTPEGSVYWNSPLFPGGLPLASANPTTNSWTSGSVTVPPHLAGFHPGPNGEYSVFRFTVPDSGKYFLVCSFFGLDFAGPTSSDVHVLENDVPLFNGEVNGFGPESATNFAQLLTLAAGDRVDFEVGYGADGTYNFDSTGFDAQIVAGGSRLVQLVQAGRIGTNFTISFPTLDYFSYAVEYNDDLSTTNWQFLERLRGDGSLLNCRVPMTNGPMRFFRVRLP